LRRGGIFKKL
jgi:hypothetical protein